MKQKVSFQQDSKTNVIYFVCTLLFAFIFFADLYIPLGVAAGVPYIAVVLMSLWLPRKSFTLKVAIVSSLLTILGLIYSPSGGEQWKAFFNRGIALFAIWATTVLTLQRKTVEEKRLAELKEKNRLFEETKILRGLLPICASCKKIRDDQGYWIQIESYIQSHSEAQFSHSICMKCQEKLYGNEDWFINRKAKSKAKQKSDD
tara:strand:- start:1153 stop:1758 length:606 start_codon:yes stop_codon:yes gene_type:complete